MYKKVSIVIPCYNESEGLCLLITRLNTLYEKIKGIMDVEVVLVDDHSSDTTPIIMRQIIYKYSWIKFQRLSKNSGSHVAIISGISRAKGDCVVFLAADLQDPPELIIDMIDKWQEGNDVVWAVRKSVKGISYTTSFFSKMFYRIMNTISIVKLPPTGADFALLDKRVAEALVKSAGSNPSLGSLIIWLGFRQAEIYYTKTARQFGKSKWTLTRKMNSFLDAFVGFSYIPMRIMIYFGFTMAGFGFLYALFIVILKIAIGKAIMGWASIMVVVLIMGGVQMIMLGMLGEYLWRNLEESRRRPLFLIEEEAGF